MDIRHVGYALNYGLERIIEGEAPAPTLPRERNLVPPVDGRVTELELLLAGRSMEEALEAAVRPRLADPAILQPGRFRDGLRRARAALRKAADAAPDNADALHEGIVLLDDEEGRRLLLSMYRNALVAG